MPKYEVKAEYKVLKSLVVTVLDGADPMDPASWEDIETEDDDDCWLYDTISAEEIPDA